MSAHGFHTFVMDHSLFNPDLPLADQLAWREEEEDWATASPQPAFVGYADRAPTGLAASRFNLAQGCRVCNGTGYASTIPMHGRLCDVCRGSGR